MVDQHEIHVRAAPIGFDELNAVADRALARMIAPLTEATDLMFARMIAPLAAAARAMLASYRLDQDGSLEAINEFLKRSAR